MLHPDLQVAVKAQAGENVTGKMYTRLRRLEPDKREMMRI